MRRVGVLRAASAPAADDRPPPALTLLGEASRAAAFSAGRSAVCGALLGSATERRRVWRWSALRSSCATWGALTFARSMPAAEADTGRLTSRDARTAWATLRQVAADGRAASEGSASEGMMPQRTPKRRQHRASAAGSTKFANTARSPPAGIMPGLMAAAPRDPPAALLGAYTLQQQVPLERFYVDDASSMAGSTTRFSSEEIAGCVRSAERDLRLVALVEEAESAAGAAAVGAGARRRAAQHRGGVARHLVTNALAASGAAAAEGLDVLVFGATDPWLEPKPNLTRGWTVSLSLSLTPRRDGPVARVPVPGGGGQVGDDGRVPGAR
eukprot:scaffold7155_cov63-Phaeocystis_antarctica.AAC.1